MSDKQVVVQGSSGGIGLGGAIFIVFLVLKLCGVINWSWWWVTAPLWIPFGLTLLIVGGALFFIILAAIVTAILDK